MQDEPQKFEKIPPALTEGNESAETALGGADAVEKTTYTSDRASVLDGPKGEGASAATVATKSSTSMLMVLAALAIAALLIWLVGFAG